MFDTQAIRIGIQNSTNRTGDLQLLEFNANLWNLFLFVSEHAELDKTIA